MRPKILAQAPTIFQFSSTPFYLTSDQRLSTWPRLVVCKTWFYLFYIPLDGPVKVVRDVKLVTPESLSRVLLFLSALERRLRTFLTGTAP